MTERRKLIINLYSNDKMSIKEIAKLLDCSIGVIYRELKLAKVSVKKPIEENPVFIRTKELYLKGLTIREIAKEEGITFQAVHERIKKLNIQKRRRYKYNLPEEEICNLYSQQKIGIKEIADKFGVRPNVISYRLRKNGLLKKKQNSKYNKKASLITVKQINDLRDKGYTVDKVCEVLKISRSTLYLKLKKGKVNG